MVLSLISLTLAEPIFAYNIFGEKWFEPPTVSFPKNNGPSCCLSKGQQERFFKAAKDAWPILKAGTGSGVIILSWTKLDDITLGVAKEKLDEASCETCGGNFFQKILEYTVRFNNSERWEIQGARCKNGYDLQGVATHELGHAIGLAHSNVPTATMKQGLNPCQNFKSTLDPDDLQGHAAIYRTKCGKRYIGNCSWIEVRANLANSCRLYTGA